MNNIYWCLLVFMCYQFNYSQKKQLIFQYDKTIHVNGLKQNTVKEIVIDKEGMTWLATEMGLYSYDGLKLRVLSDKNHPYLKSQFISNLVLDSVSGVVSFTTAPHKMNFYIKDNQVYENINQDILRKKFIFTREKNYYNQDTIVINEINNFCKKNNLLLYNYNYPNTIFTNGNYTYFAQSHTILVFEKNKKMVQLTNSFSKSLRLLKFGKCVIAYDNGKAFEIIGSKFSTKKIDIAKNLKGIPSDKRNGLEIFGNQNNYCYLKNDIIYSINYKNFKLTTSPLLRFNKKDLITVVFNKKDGKILLGTISSGLYIANQNQFFHATITDESRNSCYSIIKLNNGRFYTTSGWTFDTESRKTEVDTFTYSSALRFILEYKNSIYFEKEFDFFNPITKKKITSLHFKKGIYKYNAISYTYFKNQLWYANVKNVFYLVNDTLVPDTFLNNKFTKCEIFQLLKFNDKIIIATTNGVYLYRPFSKKLSKIRGLSNKYARYIKIIDQNSFWVGCYGDGLYIVRNNIAYRVNDKKNTIITAHAIEEDKKGNVWITTNDGLLVVNKKRAITQTLQNKTIEYYRYTVEDGLTTNEFNGGCTHPSFRNNDGLLGFPSVCGPVWFYPEKIKQQVFSGKINIENVRADGNLITFKNNTFHIPKESQLLTIEFSYPYYANRENLSVEYRFKEDKIWKEVAGNILTVSREHNGNRLFQMRIRTHNHLQNKYYTQSFSFDFEDRYYETYWFWILITILFIGLLMLFYFIGLLFNQRYKRFLEKKIEYKVMALNINIKKLEIAKKIISNSLIEKEILLKEIHHRVKNNLQIIISLLSIQAHEGKTKNIHEFLEVSENRIQSMALIHQNLYESEHLDTIPFQDYLEKLVNYLNNAIGNRSENISFQINAENVILNIETAMPLGLIINELLTNSIKYAFPNQVKGNVNIAISEINHNLFELQYSDNGIGFDTTTTQSFGLELVKILAKQLKGTVIKRGFEGTIYIIKFKQNSQKNK